MPQIPDAAVDQADANDLISLLKAIPDSRYRRGVRYPQWFLLLVAVLGILNGCRSSRDLEAFALRHRPALNQALGLDFKRWPSDATFLYLFNKAHLQTFGEVFQAWMISQIPGGTESLEQLVCDGETLRGSAVETEDGGHRLGALVTVYAGALGVALVQKAYVNRWNDGLSFMRCSCASFLHHETRRLTCQVFCLEHGCLVGVQWPIFTWRCLGFARLP